MEKKILAKVGDKEISNIDTSKFGTMLYKV